MMIPNNNCTNINTKLKQTKANYNTNNDNNENNNRTAEQIPVKLTIISI